MRYALPAIIAQVAASLYNIVDSIFVGQGVGPLAITGLALTMPMMNLSAAFGAMVGAGSAALTSIRLGQGNKAAAENILGNVVLLNLVLGVVIMIFGLIYIDELLQKNQVSVQVLKTPDQWFGVTYKEDREAVMQSIRDLVEKGVYEKDLYSDLR